MRKRASLFLILLIPLISGCWSRVETNDIAIVTAVGLDKMEDGEIRLSLQLALPRMLGPATAGSGGGGSAGLEVKSTWLVSDTGETIMDAYQKLQDRIPRKIFFTQSRVTVIGDQLARSGVSSSLDFLTRYREARLGEYIVFTKGEASDILRYYAKFASVGSLVILKYMDSETRISTRIRDFTYMLSTDGVEPVADIVGILSSEVKESRNKSTDLSVTGVAAFHKDKLVGWMDKTDVLGVLWLRNELKTAVVTVNLPDKEGGGKISSQITQSTTKIKPTLENHKVKIEVEVQTENDLFENTSKLDLSKSENFRIVEKRIENEINERVQAALYKAQKQFKSDIFGFGSVIQRKYPKVWKNELEKWDYEFPELEVNISSHATIVRTGLFNKSTMWKEKEFIR